MPLLSSWKPRGPYLREFCWDSSGHPLCPSNPGKPGISNKGVSLTCYFLTTDLGLEKNGVRVLPLEIGHGISETKEEGGKHCLLHLTKALVPTVAEKGRSLILRKHRVCAPHLHTEGYS